MKKLLVNFVLICVSWSAVSQELPDIEFSTLGSPSKGDIALILQSSNQLGDIGKEINSATNNRLSETLTSMQLDDETNTDFVLFGMTPFNRIYVTVLGSEPEPEKVYWQNLGGAQMAMLQAHSPEDTVAVAFDINVTSSDALAHFAFGAALRGYQFNKYKNTSATTPTPKLVLHTANTDSEGIYTNDLKYVAQGVYLARNMASEPGKSVYPQAFVDIVEKAFKGIDDVDIDVLKVRDMRNNNMGALMGVGQGSIHDPRMLVIEYNGADDETAPIAIVGKGITFDTGGISLKPNSGMWGMKSDLSGAAAVAGTVLAVAQRGEKINLVGFMPLAENMPAEDAIRPGDVLNTMQGTTIEIISTDAEGRLILADAVTYAQQKYKPKMLVNIATLTGSASRALSDEYAALITRDWDLAERMMDLGNKSGEHVWPLPLHPNHFKQIKSDIADIKNSGAGNPGASIGAAVIGTFVDESLPWVHLDIAGVDYLNESTDTTPKGAAGWGVRFMDEIIRSEAQQ